MFRYRISVCTPTFNRAHTLGRVYESLYRQGVSDFEWLIIDDGSSDGTDELVQSWILNRPSFSIRYYKQRNGGKMRAVNRGLQMADGELFMILDSDDYLTDDALEKIFQWESNIHHMRDRFAGLVGLKTRDDGTILGSCFQGYPVDASMKNALKQGVRGDHAEIWYTDVFRRHPFPEIEGEKFISEGVTWIEICEEEERILRWINEPIMVCEYLPDGYSMAALRLGVENPKGVLLNIKKKIHYLRPGKRSKLKMWHKYFIIGRKNCYSHTKIRKDLEIACVDYVLLLVLHYVLQSVRSVKRLWKKD